MRITGCEDCGMRDLCTPFEKSLGICDDYLDLHESDDKDDWAEDENEWAAILWLKYLNKDILEDDLITMDSW